MTASTATPPPPVCPCYFDARRCVGGVQFTIGPFSDGGPWLPYIVRLGYDSIGEMIEAMATDQLHISTLIGQPDGTLGAIIYEPHRYHDNSGTWLKATAGDSPDDEPTIDLELTVLVEVWHGVAELLRGVAALPPLNGDPKAPFTPEDYHLCGVCQRPVFDSMPTVMGTAPSVGLGFALVPMCEWCGLRELKAQP